MMSRKKQGGLTGVDSIHVEMLGMLRESVPGQRRISTRQHKLWCPPTDVYETDDCIVVKVEIAGVEETDFSISLDANKLVVSGVRSDPAEKVGYEQMEIPYGYFETDVHLMRAIEPEQIEATYQNGFLSIRLPKARPRQVPVLSMEDSA
jgi:HSP20 family protein